MTSNTINIYKNDSIEFISYGSLYGNITIVDALAGLSISRNPHLQAVFMRLKRVEAIGSGLRRVNSYYKNRDLEFVIEALPASFIVRLPRIIMKLILDADDELLIIDYIKVHGEITRKNAEQLIGREKTTTAGILNGMVARNILVKVGNGPSTKYIVQ